ncbi:hypothetical protein WDU94_011564 [Cyamophila willieti]
MLRVCSLMSKPRGSTCALQRRKEIKKMTDVITSFLSDLLCVEESTLEEEVTWNDVVCLCGASIIILLAVILANTFYYKYQDTTSPRKIHTDNIMSTICRSILNSIIPGLAVTSSRMVETGMLPQRNEDVWGEPALSVHNLFFSSRSLWDVDNESSSSEDNDCILPPSLVGRYSVDNSIGGKQSCYGGGDIVVDGRSNDLTSNDLPTTLVDHYEDDARTTSSYHSSHEDIDVFNDGFHFTGDISSSQDPVVDELDAVFRNVQISRENRGNDELLN